MSYDVLQQDLGITNIRNLEDLIIESIYEGVIKAKLDQNGKKIIVDFAIGRDLQDGDIDNMIDILTQWKTYSETLLSTISDQKNFMISEHSAIQAVKEQTKRIINSSIQQKKADSKKKSTQPPQ